jgi:hypothetical protein
MLGVKNYFITKPHHVTQAFRNTTTLSFDHFLDDHVCHFGVKKEDIPAMNNNIIIPQRYSAETNTYPAQGLNMKNFVEWAYKRQLSVDKVHELWNVYLITINHTTKLSNLEQNGSRTTYGTVTMKIRELLGCTLTISVTKMLFGTQLLETEPNIPIHAQGFIDGLWKLVYHYPKWALGSVAHDQDATIVTMERFAEQMDAETSDASWLVRTVVENQTQSKMSKRSTAALLGLIYLA